MRSPLDLTAYREDFFRLVALRPTDFVPTRLPRDAEVCLRAFLLRRAAGLRRDRRGGVLTFATTAPSVDPMDRAMLSSKPSLFAADLLSLLFIVVSWNSAAIALRDR
jgi:hypothetical protein